MLLQPQKFSTITTKLCFLSPSPMSKVFVWTHTAASVRRYVSNILLSGTSDPLGSFAPWAKLKASHQQIPEAGMPGHHRGFDIACALDGVRLAEGLQQRCEFPHSAARLPYNQAHRHHPGYMLTTTCRKSECQASRDDFKSAWKPVIFIAWEVPKDFNAAVSCHMVWKVSPKTICLATKAAAVQKM